MSVVRGRPVAAFFFLTFALSWALWGALAVTGTGIGTTGGAAVNVVALFGPTIAGLIVAALLGPDHLRRLLAGFSPDRASVRWSLVALVLPLVMAGLAIAASIALFAAPPPTLTASVVGVLLAEFVRILFVGGPLGEEVGWRGFALPRLQSNHSAWRASLLLGLVWGLWHIPLYFVPGTGQQATGGDSPVPAIVMFVVWTIGLSVLFTWLFNETRGSLIVMILFHAAVNLGSFLPSAVASTGGAAMLYGLITWLVALAVTARFGQARLSSSAPPAGQSAVPAS